LKILSVSQADIDGGAARAAHRVAAQMVTMGVDLRMQVMRKLGQDPWVVGANSLSGIMLSRLLPRAELLAKKMAGVVDGFPWSLNAFPNPMLDEAFINGFDGIHLHLIGKNMVPINWIHRIRRPTVWTLHDSWAFTGGCHFPFACRHFEGTCGNCPQLKKPTEEDLSRRIWHEKEAAYSKAPLHFVSPSRWMADEARASGLLRNAEISVIPNGLDTGVFAPTEKAFARETLGLPVDKKIILFGAMASEDPRKGLHLLVEALNHLKTRDPHCAERMVLVVFGTAEKSLGDEFPIPAIQLGFIRDDSRLARIYSAADLTTVPSMMESFGQVASESLSCGTPVVAFNATGLRDVLDHRETSYAATAFEPSDLANGIHWILNFSEAEARRISALARKQALERFDIAVTTRQHIELFGRLTAKGEASVHL